MVTQDVIEILKKLQDILVKKYDLEAKRDEAPKQLSNQKDLLEKTQKEFIEEQTQYDSIKEKVSKLKEELEEAVKTREEGEKGVANSTTHREYEALEKQILEAKNKEEEVRKELQKEERDLAELDEKLKNSNELITFQKSELESAQNSINKKTDEYTAELNQLEKEVEEITKELNNEEILFKFERIIQRNSEGIVTVKSGVCSGCHMILPADFANEVRQGDGIKFCPYCSRVLEYDEQSSEDTEDYFSLDSVGSLADFDDETFGEDEDSDEEKDYDDNLYDDDLSDDGSDDDDENQNDDEDDDGDEDSDEE
ncbi:MAG: C4-type zinc ribbon domain-containing protein [Treponema sp.]|nr:C4-type zinc ribbon domain-containing protein [Treponema sp.]MCI7565449.1 C4-type zinc ribbon domain-containing protein [Treponema sp.]